MKLPPWLQLTHDQIVYWSFLILGTGILFPWNIIITAYDFWVFEYPSSHIEFVFSIAYPSANLIFLALLVWRGTRISLAKRIWFSLVTDFALLIFLPIISSLPLPEGFRFFLTICSSIILGAATGVLQGSLFGLAAIVGPIHTQSICSGEAIAGLAVSMLRILTKASLPNTVGGLRASSAIYFILGTSVILICLFCFKILLTVPSIQQQMSQSTKSPSPSQSASASSSLSASPQNDSDEIELIEKQPAGEETEESGQKDTPPATITATKTTHNDWKATLKWIWEAFEPVWYITLLVFITFFVTLSLFPGITTSIASVSGLGDWLPVILITLFNLGDLIGRLAAAALENMPVRPPFLTKPGRYSFLVFSRPVLFYPLFLAMIGPNRTIFSDTVACIVLILFSITNGFLATMLMTEGPKRVNTDEKKELVGTLMTFFLLLGITTGANTGLQIMLSVE